MPRKGQGSKAKIRVQKGKSYGERVDSETAQAAIPVANKPVETARAAQAAAPSQADRYAAGMAAAAQMAPPAGGLSGPPPTNEPPTAGLPMGPGGGPETRPPVLKPQVSSDSLLFSRYLPVFEALANSGSSSQQYRQFVRRLRSQVPVRHIYDTVQQQAGATGGPSQGSPPGAPGGLPQPDAPAQAAQQAAAPPGPMVQPTNPAAQATPAAPSPQPGSPGMA